MNSARAPLQQHRSNVVAGRRCPASGLVPKPLTMQSMCRRTRSLFIGRSGPPEVRTNSKRWLTQGA